MKGEDYNNISEVIAPPIFCHSPSPTNANLQKTFTFGNNKIKNLLKFDFNKKVKRHKQIQEIQDAPFENKSERICFLNNEHEELDDIKDILSKSMVQATERRRNKMYIIIFLFIIMI
jgi:hypothetical protein